MFLNWARGLVSQRYAAYALPLGEVTAPATVQAHDQTDSTITDHYNGRQEKQRGEYDVAAHGVLSHLHEELRGLG
jgi:hypothetical protein